MALARNIASTERKLRVGLGLVALVASVIWWSTPFLGLPAGLFLLAAGAILIGTGLVGNCLVYRLLGRKTLE